jgi:hypothetical protein
MLDLLDSSKYVMTNARTVFCRIMRHWDSFVKQSQDKKVQNKGILRFLKICNIYIERI